MSVAYEFEPAFHDTETRPRGAAARPLSLVPAPGTRPAATPGVGSRRGAAFESEHVGRPGADVLVLHPPLDEPARIRLTRRGVVVLACLVAALGAVLVAVAALSAPSAGVAAPRGPSVVTVRAGDTLWSIASAANPNSDPAAEIATIRSLNGLHDAALVPGQRLRLR